MNTEGTGSSSIEHKEISKNVLCLLRAVMRDNPLGISDLTEYTGLVELFSSMYDCVIKEVEKKYPSEGALLRKEYDKNMELGFTQDTIGTLAVVMTDKFYDTIIQTNVIDRQRSIEDDIVETNFIVEVGRFFNCLRTGGFLANLLSRGGDAEEIISLIRLGCQFQGVFQSTFYDSYWKKEKNDWSKGGRTLKYGEIIYIKYRELTDKGITHTKAMKKAKEEALNEHEKDHGNRPSSTKTPNNWYDAYIKYRNKNMNQ